MITKEQEEAYIKEANALSYENTKLWDAISDRYFYAPKWSEAMAIIDTIEEIEAANLFRKYYGD